MTLPIDVDPAEVAVEMLKAELPGFESKIDAARDAVAIRGALPVGALLPHETIFYPLYRSTLFVDVAERSRLQREESHIARAERHARQREALKRELAPAVDRVVDNVRRLAIEAVGLEKVIAAREERAAQVGRRDGYAVGHEAGKREGREEVMREWAAAMQSLRDGIAGVIGSPDE